MESSAQRVFDNDLLRHKILTKYVYAKHIEELSINLKELLNEQIIKNWYKYCNCELCLTKRLNIT